MIVEHEPQPSNLRILGTVLAQREGYIIFFLLSCERSAKRDIWHTRNVTLALQHMEVLCYNSLNL